MEEHAAPRSWLVEKSTRGFVPLTAIVELTDRCNERCVHCYVVQSEAPGGELTTSQWCEVLGQMARAGTLEVTFSGGEVFLRRDLFEILQEARRLHFSIKVSTNATLVGPKEAARLAELKPWEVGVSLYAADPMVHDAITTVPGSHRRTLAGIQALVEAGVKVRIRSVLMRENLDQEGPLGELAARLGVAFSQDPLLTPRSDGSKENLVHRLTPDELRGVLERDLDRLLGPDDPDRWEAVRHDKLSSYMCKAGINFVAVGARGQVFPCVQFRLQAGNALEAPFRDIWNTSPVFRSLRSTVNADIPACRECEVAPLCFRCPGEALLSDGDAFGPSSYACLRARLLNELRLRRRAGGT